MLKLIDHPGERVSAELAHAVGIGVRQWIATRWFRFAQLSDLVVVDRSVMLFNRSLSNVPAAVVAGRGFVITAIAIKRTAVEELFESIAIFPG